MSKPLQRKDSYFACLSKKAVPVIKWAGMVLLVAAVAYAIFWAAKPIPYGNSFLSENVIKGLKWIGVPMLTISAIYTIFRCTRQTAHHQKQNDSGSLVTMTNNPSARVINRVGLDETRVRTILSKLNMQLTGTVTVPKEGRIASNVIAQTDKGKYVIRLYPKGCQDSKLETGNVDFEVEALSHLASKKIAVPNPQVFNNQQAILDLDGSKVLVYPVIPGKCFQQADLSTDIASRSAQLLHSMIAASQGFQPKTNPPRGDVAYILQIAERRAREFSVLRETGKSFQKLVEAVKDSGVEKRLEKTPQGIVHGDFFFENIIDGGNNQFSIIDFGDAYYGAMLMDIVISSMEFSVLSDDSWDLEMFQAALAPHSKWLKTNEVDFSLFYDALIANCLRFAVYTLPSTFSENKSVDENPYVFRFNQLQEADFKTRLLAAFSKAVP